MLLFRHATMRHGIGKLSGLVLGQAQKTISSTNTAIRFGGARTNIFNETKNVRVFSSFTLQQALQKRQQQQQHQTRAPLRLVQNQQLGALTHFSSQIPPPRGGGNRIAQGAGLIGAASLLLGKGKYVLAALKLTKFASLGSMVVSIGAYSMFFGLPYAVGIVGLITAHEAGHAYVMHLRGMPFSPMVFLPFSK